MKDIIECMQGFATPMNTIGMGAVDPCVTDPIPSISLKRKRRRKRRMKSIKEFIKESIVTEAITVDRIKNEDWDVDKLSRFLNDMKINRKDVDMFISNYPDTIKEYNFEVDDPDFEGIDELREVNKFKELDFDKDTVKELFDNVENGDDINKVFWFDNGNGIRSIIVETKFTDRMSYNVFGQDDFEDVLDCFSRENVKSEPEVGFLKYGYR